jgi:hypothetical protein
VRARIVGGLYFVSVAAAVANEALVHGKLLYLVSLVPIACFLIATVLLYMVFNGVSGRIALLAAGANIVSLGFEAVEVHPGGVNAGLVFHGLYCTLLGYLAYRPPSNIGPGASTLPEIASSSRMRSRRGRGYEMDNLQLRAGLMRRHLVAVFRPCRVHRILTA